MGGHSILRMNLWRSLFTFTVGDSGLLFIPVTSVERCYFPLDSVDDALSCAM